MMTDHFGVIVRTEENEKVFNQLADAVQASTSRRSFLRRSVVGAAMIAPLGLLAACGSQTTTTGSGGNTPTTGKTSTSTAPAGLAIPALSDNKSAFTEIMNDETAHV